MTWGEQFWVALVIAAVNVQVRALVFRPWSGARERIQVIRYFVLEGRVTLPRREVVR